MTGGMQDRRDAGQEGCRTVGMQDRRDAGEAGCRTGGMQERRDAGHILGQHVLDLKSDFTDILCGIKLLNTFFSLKKL